MFFIQTYWILFFHLNPILNIFKHNFNINSAKKKKKPKQWCRCNDFFSLPLRLNIIFLNLLPKLTPGIEVQGQ